MLFDDDVEIERDAIISPCSLYRYRLTRSWGNKQDPKSCVFVMLNPSTADHARDDTTIKRCMSFARREGCDMIEVYNLYSYRATKPADMFSAEDPVGPDGDVWLRHLGVVGADLIIAAWGHQKGIDYRVGVVRELLSDQTVYCLGRTKDGYPRHPSRLAGDTPLEVYWEGGSRC